MYTNHRRFTRINTALPCEIRVDGGHTLSGQIISLGFGGALCVVPASYAVADTVEILRVSCCGNADIVASVRWRKWADNGDLQIGLDFGLEHARTTAAISHLIIEGLHLIDSATPGKADPGGDRARSCGLWQLGTFEPRGDEKRAPERGHTVSCK